MKIIILEMVVSVFVIFYHHVGRAVYLHIVGKLVFIFSNNCWAWRSSLIMNHKCCYAYISWWKWWCFKVNNHTHWSCNILMCVTIYLFIYFLPDPNMVSAYMYQPAGTNGQPPPGQAPPTTSPPYSNYQPTPTQAYQVRMPPSECLII